MYLSMVPNPFQISLEPYKGRKIPADNSIMVKSKERKRFLKMFGMFLKPFLPLRYHQDIAMEWRLNRRFSNATC